MVSANTATDEIKGSGVRGMGITGTWTCYDQDEIFLQKSRELAERVSYTSLKATEAIAALGLGDSFNVKGIRWELNMDDSKDLATALTQHHHITDNDTLHYSMW
jgi:hypothetical protein